MIHVLHTIVNHITFGTDEASLAAFRFMLHEVRRPAHPLGSIDFNQLIPTPQDLAIEHSERTEAGLKLYRAFMKESLDLMRAGLSMSIEERTAKADILRAKWDAKEQKDPEIWKLGRQAYMNVMKYDCPTWYEWRREHWGTACNAAEYVSLDNAADTMTFTTAGAAVPKVVQAMSRRFPRQKISCDWADGETKQHLGHMVFQASYAIEVEIPDEPAALAQAMSAGIWRFQAEMERSASPVRSSQKKTDHRRAER